jgi:acetate kinase
MGFTPLEGLVMGTRCGDIDPAIFGFLEGAVDLGNRNAIEALEVYAHRVRKYIGAYSAELFKVDGLVFTGGIGQHGVRMRERICHRLENIGIIMDYAKNDSNGSREGIVSTPYSPTTILVVPTNEELQIVIDAEAKAKVLPIAIDIRRGERQLFHASLPGAAAGDCFPIIVIGCIVALIGV